MKKDSAQFCPSLDFFVLFDQAKRTRKKSTRANLKIQCKEAKMNRK
jgi:hypothetical protein